MAVTMAPKLFAEDSFASIGIGEVIDRKCENVVKLEIKFLHNPTSKID